MPVVEDIEAPRHLDLPEEEPVRGSARPRRLPEGQMPGRPQKKNLPQRNFRVVILKAPARSHLRRGDYDEFECFDEIDAIVEFKRKYRVDPDGRGLGADYNFHVEQIDGQFRLRAPYKMHELGRYLREKEDDRYHDIKRFFPEAVDGDTEGESGDVQKQPSRRAGKT